MPRLIFTARVKSVTFRTYIPTILSVIQRFEILKFIGFLKRQYLFEAFNLENK